MDIAKLHNPYDFANPVSETASFVGRRDERDDIRYYLDQARTAPRPINIALLGARAAGKTSLLNITEILAKERDFCTVRIDLDEGDVATQIAFFFKLFDSVLTAACHAGAYGGRFAKTYDTYLDIVSSYRIPDDKTFCPFLFPIQYARAMAAGNLNIHVSDQNLRTDLTAVSEELKHHLLVLVDEGNVLAKSRVHLEKLRNIFMNLSGYMLVLTGTPDLFPVMDDVFSPIVRQFKKI
jgi:AAA+ ATPase superfamily predicted ATPase